MSSQIVDASDVTLSGGTGLVVLDGIGLGVVDVVRLADGGARPVPGTDAMKRATESWDAARQIAATGRVYGRSTGVGANRNEPVPTEAAAEHGLRLLRSHAGAIGDELPAREVRAMLAVRANQLLAGVRGYGLRSSRRCARRWRAGCIRSSTSSGRWGRGISPRWLRWGWRWRGSIPGGARGTVSPAFPSPSPSTTTTPSP